MSPTSSRERLLAAALTCIEAQGLAGTTVEDVARAASLSRATVYRQFPRGREQLVSETVTWEVARFFGRVEERVAAEPDLAGALRVGLAYGHRVLDDHTLLQRLLRTEPEVLLPEIDTATRSVLDLVTGYLADELGREVAEGRARTDLDVDEAADHLAHLFLSYLGSPGRWDLDEPDQVDQLVRTQFLAGVVAPA